MKPRDLLLLRFRAHVVEPLAREGWRFSASKLHLGRTIGDVKQHIEICSNRYNRDDDAEFWTMWSVRSTAYPRWYAETWGEETTYDLLGESAEWNIVGWDRGRGTPKFTLRNTTDDAREMAEFLAHVRGPGYRWLERVSTWQGAAEERVAQRSAPERAADFFMIAGQPERARATLLDALDAFERRGLVDTFGALPRIRARLQRHFPDSLPPER